MGAQSDSGEKILIKGTPPSRLRGAVLVIARRTRAGWHGPIFPRPNYRGRASRDRRTSRGTLEGQTDWQRHAPAARARSLALRPQGLEAGGPSGLSSFLEFWPRCHGDSSLWLAKPLARFPLFLKIRHFQEEPERVGWESRQRGCPALLPPYNTMASSGSSTGVFHLFTRLFSRFSKQPEKVFGLPSASPGTRLGSGAMRAMHFPRVAAVSPHASHRDTAQSMLKVVG